MQTNTHSDSRCADSPSLARLKTVSEGERRKEREREREHMAVIDQMSRGGLFIHKEQSFPSWPMTYFLKGQYESHKGKCISL